MVIVEHKLQQLMKIVDRIIVLNFGNIIAEGTGEQLLQDEVLRKTYLGL